MTATVWFEAVGPERGGGRVLGAARALHTAGQPVTLVLVDNGVFGALAPECAAAVAAGLPVLVDRAACATRGLVDAVAAVPGLRLAEAGDFARLLLVAGTKAVWHG